MTQSISIVWLKQFAVSFAMEWSLSSTRRRPLFRDTCNQSVMLWTYPMWSLDGTSKCSKTDCQSTYIRDHQCWPKPTSISSRPGTGKNLLLSTKITKVCIHYIIKIDFRQPNLFQEEFMTLDFTNLPFYNRHCITTKLLFWIPVLYWSHYVFILISIESNRFCILTGMSSALKRIARDSCLILGDPRAT